MQQTYRIATFRLEKVRKQLAALQRKAKKFGQSLSVEEIETETEPVLDDAGQSTGINRHYTTVQLTGVEPIVNGYRFIGVCEHHGTGNIFSALPGEAIPETYRHRPRQCDHCHTARDRKDTYIIRHEGTAVDSEHAGEGADDVSAHCKQIGKNCLKDYLGGHDPHALLALLEEWAKFEADLTEQEPDDGGESYGPAIPNTIDIPAILTYAAAASTQFGYVSRKLAREVDKQTTSERVLVNLDPFKRSKLHRKDIVTPTERDNQEADAALLWIRGIDTQTHEFTNNDYLRNVYYACQADEVAYKNFGLVVSLIPSYRRHVEKETQLATTRRENPATNEYVGDLKQRLNMTLTCTRIHDYESDFSGVCHIHSFTDEAGHVLTWFTNSTRLEEGKTYPLTGTIKDHKINSKTGKAETVLTRCKVNLKQMVIEEATPTREAPPVAAIADVDNLLATIHEAQASGKITQLQAEATRRTLDHTRRIITTDDTQRAQQALDAAIELTARNNETLRTEALADMVRAGSDDIGADRKAGMIRVAAQQAVYAGLMPQTTCSTIRDVLYDSGCINNPEILEINRRAVIRYLTVPLADRVSNDEKAAILTSIMQDAAKGNITQPDTVKLAALFQQVSHAMTRDDYLLLTDALAKAIEGNLDSLLAINEPAPAVQNSLF